VPCTVETAVLLQIAKNAKRATDHKNIAQLWVCQQTVDIIIVMLVKPIDHGKVVVCSFTRAGIQFGGKCQTERF